MPAEVAPKMQTSEWMSRAGERPHERAMRAAGRVGFMGEERGAGRRSGKRKKLDGNTAGVERP